MESSLSQLDPAPYPPRLRMPIRQTIELGRKFHLLGERARDVGPVVALDLRDLPFLPTYVFVASPQGMHDLLGGSKGDFDKGAALHLAVRDTWGPGSFALAHDPWLPRRRALQPAFTKRQVEHYGSNIADTAETMVAEWLTLGTVDLDAQARRLALQVLGRSVLGRDLGPQAETLGPHVKRVAEYPMRRVTLPVMPPHRLTPGYRSFRRSLTEMQRVAGEVVDSCRTDPERDAPLVRELLEAVDAETGRPLSDEDVVAELLGFLFAGHDTTATTVTYTLWQLARQPEIQERVAAEVGSLGDAPLVPADLPRLPFTVQAVHESLRLCPPGAAVARLAMRDTVVDGFRVDAGTQVVGSIYALHRDPALWDEPTRYDPDRFDAGRLKTLDRWQYLPFGGGPRSCIGDHFAMLEAVLTVATVVRRARLSTDAGFEFALPFTMVAAHPVRATLTPRRQG